MNFKGYAKSVVGSRENNEDSFLISDEKFLYAVADGIGGGLNGEVASKMAVDGLALIPDGRDQLRPTIMSLQDAVYKHAMQTIGEPLMGTTLTAIRLFEGEAELCHVGDSRCYLFTEGHLKLLTEDHELYDESIQAEVLASYLGLSPEVAALTIQEDKIPVVPGERLLLCSDGLYKQLPQARIEEVINQYLSFPETILETLCEEASREDFSDNVTIVYVEVN